jgi:hypothetical protein
VVVILVVVFVVSFISVRHINYEVFVEGNQLLLDY